MSATALGINTPGLLFPAISLLMLAYSNRFLGLAGLMRGLIDDYRGNPTAPIRSQIESLRLRIGLLRHVQALGVLSLLLCTITLFALFLEQQMFAQMLFALSLVAMVSSLGLALIEIHLSVRALNIEVATLDDPTQEA